VPEGVNKPRTHGVSTKMRGFALFALAACAAPPASVLHGEHTDSPLANLAQVWRVDATLRTAFADGRWLTAFVIHEHGESALQLIDQRDGHTLPALVIPELADARQPVMAGPNLAAYSVAHHQIVLVQRPSEHDDHVVAKWGKPFGDDPMLVRRIGIDRERVYVSFTPSVPLRNTALVALRVDNGELAWRRTLPDHADPTMLEGGPRAFVAGTVEDDKEAFAVGFDPATGGTRWTYRGPAARDIATDDTRIVLIRTGSVVVIDRETGHQRELRVPEIHENVVPDLVLRDGIAYIASGLDDLSAGSLFALALDDGRMLWHRTMPSSHTRLATARAIYAVTTGGVIHALDRNTGALLWEWSLGDYILVNLVEGTVGDERVFAIRRGSIRAFAPTAVPPPVEDAVIRGKLIHGCPGKQHAISVGDVDVVSRVSGDFEAHVRARGTLAVTASLASGVQVELTGRRVYRLAPIDLGLCYQP
jgi:PQQ-like domain